MSSINLSTISQGGRLRPVLEKPASKIQMTSLVDMMVILVVFLLMSFSVEGQLVTPAAGLQLPLSSSDGQIVPGILVEVGVDYILVGGQKVMSTIALAESDSTNIVPLKRALAETPVEFKDGKILVQADRRIEFVYLNQVLRACAQTGWSDVSLLVLGDES